MKPALAGAERARTIGFPDEIMLKYSSAMACGLTERRHDWICRVARFASDEVHATRDSGYRVWEPQSHEDSRGFFLETYHADEFERERIPARFVQDNHWGSKQGGLRGLHYQLPHAQGKLVKVVVGEVFDVAVDMRRCSPTIGHYAAQRLSAQNRLQLWIPPGFAHGFCALSDGSEALYKVAEFYEPEWNRTSRWNDPELGIDWPLIDGKPPVLSPKDSRGPNLRECELHDN